MLDIGALFKVYRQIPDILNIQSAGNGAEARTLMRRVAFTMKLKAGYAAEYQKRHDQIWPELIRELEAAGVSDYSIYLDPQSLVLFACQKVKDHDGSAALPQSAIVKKWWKYMGDIMETNPDNSPLSVNLTEVFHMD